MLLHFKPNRPLPAHSLCAATVVVVVTSLGDAAPQGQLSLLFQSNLSESCPLQFDDVSINSVYATCK